MLAQELEPLNARIDEGQQAVARLEGDLREVEAELETFALERQRVEILQDACAALDRLQDLGAADLFWDGLANGEAAAVHSERLRGRIADFNAQTAGLEETRAALRTQIDRQWDELEEFHYEVQQAYAREERRLDEFQIDREISSVPSRPTLMPWSKDPESDRRFQRALRISLLFCLFLGVTIPLVRIPLPDRTQAVPVIPQRLAMLVKQEPLEPAPAPQRPPEEKKVEPEPEKPAEPRKAPEEKKAEPQKPKPAAPEAVAVEPKKEPERPPPEAKPAESEAKVARKTAEKTGVLAFKSSFSDLMEEVPVAKIGAEARLQKTDPKMPGQARAQRALVAIQAEGGGSGGISNHGVSRNLGGGGQGGGHGYATAGQGGTGYGTGGQIGGVGLAQVESALAGLTAEEGRPLSDGPGAGRTDEEIQIVFDRYKATLYRIYNAELRKDPTLRGKLLLRITIEPDGAISFCRVESTDLASAELVAKVVARVERFNFGPKDDVPPTTILYPIDFLPAG
ncbi:MAG: AgmX/PglI C-terminal domain-containing protein [Deferrisomatales bacterium]|nr:AgmX/PglI C-terminal domain-containing protein [Deferrisomatales bacterium]